MRINKYYYIFSIALIRFIYPLINKIDIQNYYNKKHSFVDYFLHINEETLFIFFLLIYKNLFCVYDQLLNITCIDNLNLFKDAEKRFTLVYVLNNINTTSRILILFSFSQNSLISSISSMFKASTWLEREIYDLFGVFFSEHNDLRRILTDYGFKGFPLRKDFPLTGYIELRYNEALKCVQYQRVKLIQEYRFFHFQSAWKNAVNSKIIGNYL